MTVRKRNPQAQVQKRHAKRLLDTKIAGLDDGYDMFCLSQGDELSVDQVKQVFDGELDKVEERLLEWWDFDARRYSVDYELDQILDGDERELLETNDLLDELREAIEERDTSDVFGELLRATPDMFVRYGFLDIEIGWAAEEDEIAEAVAEICSTTGLDPAKNDSILRQLLAEASYGGRCSVLWHADISKLVKEVFIGEPPANGPMKIRWTDDPYLLIYDGVNGSGSMEQVKGTVSVPFDRDSLQLDMGKWSWSGDIAGLCVGPFKGWTPEIVSEFDEYREGVQQFFDYRAAILERA